MEVAVHILENLESTYTHNPQWTMLPLASHESMTKAVFLLSWRRTLIGQTNWK